MADPLRMTKYTVQSIMPSYLSQQKRKREGCRQAAAAEGLDGGAGSGRRPDPEREQAAGDRHRAHDNDDDQETDAEASAAACGDEEQRAAAVGRQEARGHANHLRGDTGSGKAGD